MAAVAAPVLDWSGLTTYRAAIPVPQLGGVVVVPSQFNPVSKSDDNLCPVSSGGGTFAYPMSS